MKAFSTVEELKEHIESCCEESPVLLTQLLGGVFPRQHSYESILTYLNEGGNAQQMIKEQCAFLLNL